MSFEEENPLKIWRICICPECKKKHERMIFYTGRAKFPPYRCKECKYNYEYNTEEQPLVDHEYHHNISKGTLE